MSTKQKYAYMTKTCKDFKNYYGSSWYFIFYVMVSWHVVEDRLKASYSTNTNSELGFWHYDDCIFSPYFSRKGRRLLFLCKSMRR